MRIEEEINAELDRLAVKTIWLQQEHKRLSQIDMLSSTGNQLREELNKTRGKIEVLRWVLQKVGHYDMEGNSGPGSPKPENAGN